MALVFAISLAMVGVGVLMIPKKWVVKKIGKKAWFLISSVLFVIGFAIYSSFLCSFDNEHLNSVSSFEEYPIEKVTLEKVYFDGNDGWNFDESYVVLEEPSSEYENIVVKETENFEIKWLFWNVKYNGSICHVYLSDEVYKRFKNGVVIYESSNE